jgi:hypothetical protein
LYECRSSSEAVNRYPYAESNCWIRKKARLHNVRSSLSNNGEGKSKAGVVLDSHRERDIGVEWIAAIPRCAWSIDRLAPRILGYRIDTAAC